jgi:hypothetical protein
MNVFDADLSRNVRRRPNKSRFMCMSKAVIVRLSVLLSVCALLIGTLSGVRAEEVTYANIGWWTVVYRQFDNLTGCSAESRFTDQTLVQFALIETQGDKGWVLFLSNPQWDAWVKKRGEHRLIILADGKIWRGSFKVADEQQNAFRWRCVDRFHEQLSRRTFSHDL